MENIISVESEESRLARWRSEVKQRVARANGDTVLDPQSASKERPAWASPRRVPESPAERSARLDSEVKRRVLREISSPTVGGRLLKYATPKKQGSNPELDMDSTTDATSVLYGMTRLDCEDVSPEAETPKLRHRTEDAESSSYSTAGETDSAQANVLMQAQKKPVSTVHTNSNNEHEASVSCANEVPASASDGGAEEASTSVSANEPAVEPPPERRWAYGSELELAIEEQFSNSNLDQGFGDFGPAQSVNLQAIFQRQSISYTKRYSTGDWSQVCYNNYFFSALTYLTEAANSTLLIFFSSFRNQDGLSAPEGICAERGTSSAPGPSSSSDAGGL